MPPGFQKRFLIFGISQLKKQFLTWKTWLHPQGKGGPEGDFLCVENTLNVDHTYHDVTISKSFNYRFGMKTQNICISECDKNWQIWSKIDKFDQIWSKWDKNDHFWSDAHTSVFRGMSVRIANTKSPFGAIMVEALNFPICSTLLFEFDL